MNTRLDFEEKLRVDGITRRFTQGMKTKEYFKKMETIHNKARLRDYATGNNITIEEASKILQIDLEGNLIGER